MTNRIEMAKVNAIKTLRNQGWSQRKIAEHLGVNRETVARYLAEDSSKPAKAPLGSEDSKPAKAPSGSDRSRSDCESHRQRILAMLEQGLSAKRIHQDLVEEGFTGSYYSVRRFVQALRKKRPLPFRRLESPPAEEAQVDFGKGAPVRQPNGRKKRSHLFRIVLSHSRKAYSEVVDRQTTENFVRALENAFWHFGGVTKTLVIDNLRAAVTKADWFEPELNPKVESFCQHYGVVILPTRPRTPRHKGKVEKGVDYAQDNALKAKTFDSFSEQNEYLLRWETTIADTRIHGTTRKQVGKRFREVEKPRLQTLPRERFPFFHEGQRRVHRDGHVEVDKSYYSAPPEYVGRQVWVRWDTRLVRLFNNRQEQLAVHVKREPGKFSTHASHLADEKIATVERGAEWLLRKAGSIGPHSGQWAEAVIQQKGVAGLRVLQGLLALTKKHSAKAIEDACEIAASYGAYKLANVRRLIERKAPKQEQLEFIEDHPIVRNMEVYGELVRDAFRRQQQRRSFGS